MARLQDVAGQRSTLLDVLSSSNKLEVLAVLKDFDIGQLDAIFQEHTPATDKFSAGYSDIL